MNSLRDSRIKDFKKRGGSKDGLASTSDTDRLQLQADPLFASFKSVTTTKHQLKADFKIHRGKSKDQTSVNSVSKKSSGGNASVKSGSRRNSKL